MAVDHRLLNRMQVSVFAAQSFDRDQFFPVDSRQKLYAGIYGLEFNVCTASINLDENNSAGSAVSLGTTLFRTLERQVLPQELQYGPRRIGNRRLNDVAIEQEPDTRCRHS